MNLNSRDSLIARIRRSKRTREQFVASHIAKTLAFQVRALRQRTDCSQKELGESIGSNQNSIYRLESAVASPNISYLKKLAAKFDVALVIRFVPYGELVDWVSGTPRIERGLRTSALDVIPFVDEFGESNEPMAHKPPRQIDSLGDVPIVMARAEVIDTEQTTAGYGLPFNEAATEGDAVQNAGDNELRLEAVG